MSERSSGGVSEKLMVSGLCQFIEAECVVEKLRLLEARLSSRHDNISPC